MGWKDAPLAEQTAPAWQQAPEVSARPSEPSPAPAAPTVTERLKAQEYPTMVAGGAIAGSVIGGAGGAVLGGPVGGAAGFGAGGSAGAAAGALAFNQMQDVISYFSPGYQPAPGYQPTTAGRLQQAGKEAAFDLATSAVSPLLFPVRRFLGPLVGKVAGVTTDAAKYAADIAKAHGIGVGAVDVGNLAPKMYAKVAGVFPFIQAPMRAAYLGRPARGARPAVLGKQAQLEAAVINTLNTVAPTAIAADELGVDMFNAAKGTSATFRNTAATLYDEYRTAARGASVPEIIPTTATKDQAAKWIKEFELGNVPLKQIAPATPADFAAGKVQGIGAVGGGTLAQKPDAFEQYLSELSALPDRITFDQSTAIQARLERFAAAGDSFTIKRVAQLKRSMEADANNLQTELLAPGEGDRIKGLKEGADKFFSNGILLFQGATARKFMRAEPNIFGAGFKTPGALNPDELLKPVFDAESPQALKQLRGLVGPELFNKSSRNWLQNGFETAIKSEQRAGQTVQILDPDQLAKNWGLQGGPRNRTAAIEEMLKGTNVTLQDLKELTQQIKITAIGDPATMVMRRAILGGVAAGVSAATVFGPLHVAMGSPVLAALAAVGARRFSRLLATPDGLKMLTGAMKPNVDDLTRRAAYLRLLRMTGGPDAEFQQ